MRYLERMACGHGFSAVRRQHDAMNLLRSFALGCTFLLLCGGAFAAPPPVGELLHARLQPEGGQLPVAAGIPLTTGAELRYFYQAHTYQPVWSVGGQLRGAAGELLTAIAATLDDGLAPGDYHQVALDELRRRFAAQPNDALAAELDLLLSDAFFRIAADYRYGRFNPDRSEDPVGEGARLLDQALASGQVRAVLQAQLPRYPDYAVLREAYKHLRQLALAGDWGELPARPVLRPGRAGAEVAALRERLAAGGDLPAAAVGGELFDEELTTALQRFQLRHGLPADGIAGPQTLRILNVPAAERATQLAVNLERRRWLPRDFARRALIVNIPAFRLELFERGALVLEMPVIVGKPRRSTPELASSITAVVFNPQWDVPFSIASADLLPMIRDDADYLPRNGFRVFSRESGEEVDPATIDWASLSRSNFPYHLRQEPGPSNALGRLKFILPNDNAIYLHDTPTRRLFEAEKRAFSSGCVRLEQPRAFALYLLAGSDYGDAETLDKALRRGERRMIELSDPLPAYFVYWSAWADSDGAVQFRPDLYGRDAALLEQLTL